MQSTMLKLTILRQKQLECIRACLLHRHMSSSRPKLLQRCRTFLPLLCSAAIVCTASSLTLPFISSPATTTMESSGKDNAREKDGAGKRKDVASVPRKIPRRLQRFRNFASLEFHGSEYMSPRDFLDSVIMESRPTREGPQRRILSEEVVTAMLKKTPTLREGSERMFRELGEDGLISYAEYLFIFTLLTKSSHTFNIAFMMFDEDDNMHIDKEEFLKLEEMMRAFSRRYTPPSNKETSIGSGETAHVKANKSGRLASEFSSTNTTILIHLFGKDGKGSLSFDEFQIFYKNLQRELIEIEFQAFAGASSTIAVKDFTKLVLRYSTLDPSDQSRYLQRVHDRSRELSGNGITYDQFEQFSLFLNHLEDFAKAVRLYTAAGIPVSRSEFIRAVQCSTGISLDPHLVDVLYCIFDVNDDDRLSYSEFIAIMNDRLHRGFKGSTMERHSALGWKPFRDCMVKELANFR